MRRRFIRYLSHGIKEQGARWTPASKRDLNYQISLLVADEVGSIEGNAERYHLELACTVLAAHRLLATYPSIPLAKRQELLLAALLRPSQNSIRWLTKVMLALSRDPMKSIISYCRNRLPAMYGNAFSFSYEGDESSSYTVRVTRCFYHEFFKKHGSPELARLFCEWDQAWIGAISEQRHQVRFQRPETIAADGKSCPFIFTRLE